MYRLLKVYPRVDTGVLCVTYRLIRLGHQEVKAVKQRFSHVY